MNINSDLKITTPGIPKTIDVNYDSASNSNIMQNVRQNPAYTKAEIGGSLTVKQQESLEKHNLETKRHPSSHAFTPFEFPFLAPQKEVAAQKKTGSQESAREQKENKGHRV